MIRRVDGDATRLSRPFTGPARARIQRLLESTNRGSLAGRAIIDRQTIHIHDLAAESKTEFPDAASVQQDGQSDNACHAVAS